MDAYQKAARAANRAEYAELDQQHMSGQLTYEQFEAARKALDQRVQNQADTMAWNRHALAQSELKANSIPTPDQPVSLAAPGSGAIPDTLYNTARRSATSGQQSTYLGTSSAY